VAGLTPTMQAFVLHWGEMGTRWGINRTVAQIHALLFLSPEPLNAGEIAETLAVARSNVSNSLRELQSWGIVKVVHVMGDRRDHYEAMQDVWEMFQLIVDERKKRECDPTLTTLRDLTTKAKKPGAKDAYARERLVELLDFYETITGWYEQMRRMPTKSIIRFVKMGDKVRRLLGRAS
jgi:DNA-binding transcriptional regulator GbsR (MarR family)